MFFYFWGKIACPLYIVGFMGLVWGPFEMATHFSYTCMYLVLISADFGLAKQKRSDCSKMTSVVGTILYSW